MTRSKIWIGIIIGGALYQLTKSLLGFSVTLETWFDSVYWSGTALLWHWAVTPAPEELIVKSYLINGGMK